MTYSLEGKFSDPGFTAKQHPGKIIDGIISLTINDTMCWTDFPSERESVCTIKSQY